jgi:NADH dehydrogenase
VPSESDATPLTPPGDRANGKPRIVIVGAGFAGLDCARALKDAPVEITLIDRENHHLFQPLLYQVATAALSAPDVAWPVRSLVRKQKNVTVLMEEALSIDRSARTVTTDRGEHPYDHLVVATGTRFSYFGNDRFAAYAPGLKSLADATEIRARLLLAFERAEMETDPERRARLLTFVVVGGGSTGVEVAGTLVELARHTLARDFRLADPRHARIVLAEGVDNVLPGYTERLRDYTRRTLAGMGVELRLGRMVVDIDDEGVTLDDDTRIATETIVWAAGNEATPLIDALDAEQNRKGQAVVTSRLHLPDDPTVFVIGDCAHVEGPDGEPLPATAPPAKQQGDYVGKLLRHRAGGGRDGSVPPFRYRDYGALATIGRHAAIADLPRLKLSGALAWWFWGLVHIAKLTDAPSRVQIMLRWAFSYASYRRGARLIVRQRAAKD